MPVAASVSRCALGFAVFRTRLARFDSSRDVRGSGWVLGPGFWVLGFAWFFFVVVRFTECAVQTATPSTQHLTPNTYARAPI